MIITSTLLLVLVSTCVHSQIVLTQSEQSIVVAPGGSHKLTCVCSGFNVGGTNMYWIRQAPGKGLEWIIYYYSDSYKSSAQTVQGRFTGSKDRSNFYLHMSQLKPEDTAVYYCARERVARAFDYWGKGTMVTVSSGGRTAPTSIFAMSQCGSGSDGFLTLGCLTSGFSPADSLKFKWTDPNGKDLTDFIQYPAIGNNGAYTSVSHVRVKPADWSTENAFTCTAEHPEGNKTEKPKIKKKITSKEEDNKKVTVNKEGTVNKEAQDLNINIYEPSNANGPQAVSLVCEINGSGDLGDVHVTWTKDKKTYIDGKITSPILKEDKSTSVFSILTVTAQDFNNPSVVFTCAVKHAGMKNESMPLMASTSKSKPKCPECPVC